MHVVGSRSELIWRRDVGLPRTIGLQFPDALPREHRVIGCLEVREATGKSPKATAFRGLMKWPFVPDSDEVGDRSAFTALSPMHLVLADKYMHEDRSA